MTLALQLIEQHLAGSPRELVLDNALCEVNVKSLKQKNPAASIFIDKLIQLQVPNKYLQWATVQFNRAKKARQLNDRPFSPGEAPYQAIGAAEFFAVLLKRFDKLLQQKKITNAIKIGLYDHGAADINKWDDLEDLTNMLAHVEDLKSRKEIKVSGSDTIYRDDRFTVYRPFTHDASKQLGAGTKWCISAHSSQYYDQYTSQGKMFAMIMDRYAKPDNPYNKVAISVDLTSKSRSDWEIFDAPDSSIRSSELAHAYGRDNWTKIEGAIEKYSDKQEIPTPERQPGEVWAGDRVDPTESHIDSQLDYWKEDFTYSKYKYLPDQKNLFNKVLGVLLPALREIYEGASGTVTSPTRVENDEYDTEIEVQWEYGSLPYSWDETKEEALDIVPLPEKPINPLKQPQPLLPIPGQAKELADKYTAELAAYTDAMNLRGDIELMAAAIEGRAEKVYTETTYPSDVEVTWRNNPADAIRDYGPID